MSKKEKVKGIVDYAHTPDALENVLKTIEDIRTKNEQLITVVGCGGDRDLAKRPQMGKLAQELADHIVITSDNPRSEEPASIIAMIQSGMSGDLSNVQVLPDRAAAIMAAVRHADIKDIVLVAGKGHESTQEINGKKFDFSDQEHILLAAGGNP